MQQETGSEKNGLPKLIKKLDWYIIRHFLGTFFFIIAGLAVISCAIDLAEKVGDFIQKKAPVAAVLGYFLTFIPYITGLLFPLFIFIAVIFFTSRMAYRSEVIVMLATGMSFLRFLRPFIIAGAFLAALFLLANHILIPLANKQRIDFLNRYYHEIIYNSDQDVHLQLDKGLIVRMHSYDYTQNRGSGFGADRFSGTVIRERLFAESASYDSVKQLWTLKSVTIRKMDSLEEKLEQMPELTQQYSFTPKDLKHNDEIKETMTTPELNRFIAVQRQRGNPNLNVFILEKYRRTANPFAAIILTVIGAIIASRKVRGGSGLHLALGIVLSAAYMLALQVTNTFSVNAGFSPLVAVWIPNFIFGIFALYLLRRQLRRS